MTATPNPNSPFFHEQRHLSLGTAAELPLTICGAGALGGDLASPDPDRASATSP